MDGGIDFGGPSNTTRKPLKNRHEGTMKAPGNQENQGDELREPWDFGFPSPPPPAWFSVVSARQSSELGRRHLGTLGGPFEKENGRNFSGGTPMSLTLYNGEGGVSGMPVPHQSESCEKPRHLASNNQKQCGAWIKNESTASWGPTNNTPAKPPPPHQQQIQQHIQQQIQQIQQTQHQQQQH